MKYEKIPLEEPIYELQEKEKPRQHYFIDLYYDVDDDNIIKFIKSFDGLDKGDKWEYGGCTTVLDYKPYAYSTFRNLFGILQASIRRHAYWKDTFSSDRKKRQTKIKKFMNTFTDDIIDSTNNLKVTEEEIDYDDSKAHLKAKGKSDIAGARKDNWGILKDLGDIEDPAQKHKIEGNIDSNVDVKRNLSEDMILNPKYAELTKQLREDVLNGRTDSSEDTG